LKAKDDKIIHHVSPLNIRCPFNILYADG